MSRERDVVLFLRLCMRMLAAACAVGLMIWATYEDLLQMLAG